MKVLLFFNNPTGLSAIGRKERHHGWKRHIKEHQDPRGPDS